MDIKAKINNFATRFKQFWNVEDISEPQKTVCRKKVFTHNNSGFLRKILVGTAFVSSFSLGAQAKEESKSDGEPSFAKSEASTMDFANEVALSTKIYSPDIAEFSDINKLKDVKSKGIYNGHEINLASLRPEQVVHYFESSNDPTKLDAKNIENANALGDYQFNLNNTIYNFVKYCRNDFPELAQAAGVNVKTGRIMARNARTAKFYKTYCNICKGPRAEEFAQKRFDFMFKTHFQPVFDELHTTNPDFPHITKENYNDPENKILSILVMSTATQSPRNAPKIINRQVNAIKKNAVKNGKNSYTMLDVFNSVYKSKMQKWGFATRYKAEMRLAADLNNYLASIDKIVKIQKQQENKIEIAPIIPTATLANVAANNAAMPKLNVSTPKNKQSSIKQDKQAVVIAAKSGKTNKNEINKTKTTQEKSKALPSDVQLANTETPLIQNDVQLANTETPLVQDDKPKLKTSKQDSIRRLVQERKKAVKAKVIRRNTKYAQGLSSFVKVQYNKSKSNS